MARAGKVTKVDMFHDLGTVKCTRNPEDVDSLMDDEINGYVEYLMQAEVHPKPQVRRTFESMAVDEYNHFRILQQLKEHGHLNPKKGIINYIKNYQYGDKDVGNIISPIRLYEADQGLSIKLNPKAVFKTVIKKGTGSDYFGMVYGQDRKVLARFYYTIKNNRFIRLCTLEVESSHRRTGIGTMVMRKLIHISNLKRLPITFVAAPLEKGVSINRLVKFYKTFGCKILSIRGSYVDMVYLPQTKRR